MGEFFGFGFENVLIGLLFDSHECFYPARESDMQEETSIEENRTRASC